MSSVPSCDKNPMTRIKDDLGQALGVYQILEGREAIVGNKRNIFDTIPFLTDASFLLS